MKILIIEDEPELARSIADYLSGEQYRCEIASDFRTALERTELYDYSCIILDLMLPGGDGMRILESLRRDRKTDGVVIISAKDGLEDRIKGLQTGADDYLAKPFHLSELAARVYAVIRRRQLGSSNILEQNELQIDLPARQLRVNGLPVSLTPKEYDLLLYFISNRNRVVSKNALAEHLLGDMADMLDNYDVIYAHVKNLKKKLAEAGCDTYLKTIYGTGYKWEI